MKLADLNSSALEPVGIAGGGAELTHRAESTTGQSQRVIGEDSLGGAVVVLVLNLIDEGSDVDTDGACFLAGAIGTFHAPRSLRYCLLLGIDSIVEVPSPIASEVFGLDPLEFDLMLFPILLSSLGVDDLGRVELGGSWED